MINTVKELCSIALKRILVIKTVKVLQPLTLQRTLILNTTKILSQLTLHGTLIKIISAFFIITRRVTIQSNNANRKRVEYR